MKAVFTLSAAHKLHIHILTIKRIGRWGSCSSCPKNERGIIHPEFCQYTTRFDHELTLEKLAEQFGFKLADMKEVLQEIG